MPLVDKVEDSGLFGDFDLPEDDVEKESEESQQQDDTPPEEPEETPQDEPEIQDETEEEPSEEDLEEEPEQDPDQEADEEETPDEEEEELPSVAEEVQEVTGLELDGDYEDSVEGISKMIMDAGEELANSQIENLMEEYPDVGQYLQFRANGGDPDEYRDTFFNSEGWSGVEIREDDATQQENIVRARLQEEGYDEEDIDETVEEYKSAGILESEARRSKKRLENLEQQQQEELLEKQEERAKERQREQQEFLNEVETTVQENTDFNGIGLPETKKDDFLEYLTEPVDDEGNTQYALDTMSAGVEDQIAMALMSFYGFDISDLIQREASSENAKSLRERLSRGGKKKPSDKSKTRQKSKSDEVDFDALSTDVGNLT